MRVSEEERIVIWRKFRDLVKYMLKNRIGPYAKLTRDIFEEVYGEDKEKRLEEFMKIGYVKLDGSSYVLTREGKDTRYSGEFEYEMEKKSKI